MKQILITGGLGYVGGRLAKKLSDSFNIVLSSRKPINEEVMKWHCATEQVAHADLLKAETFPSNIDTVIHMASLNEIDCVRYPSEAIKVNIDETRIILENAIQAGVKNFIYFSTAHIYGSPLQGVIDETTLPVPVHPYAITHKAAEDYVVAADRQKKINATIVRLSNSFGAPVMAAVNRWTLLANDLCRQAIEKNSMRLSSNGCQYRDFVCLTDVEQVIGDMCTQKKKCSEKVYNLGAGVSMKVIDMARLIAEAYQELFDKEIAIELPPGAVPTTESYLDFRIDRLRLDGYSINNNFKSEIKELLLFCKTNFGAS